MAAIERGERETTEFKAFVRIRDPKMREVHKTVVAFSNSRGGVLVIGVDHNCNVLGVERPLLTEGGKRGTVDSSILLTEYVAGLRKAITDAVVPSAEFRVRAVEHTGHTLVAVYVGERPHKPYALSDSNEFYVRRGANSAKASAEGMRSIFEARSRRWP